jgi:hypothetical protein
MFLRRIDDKPIANKHMAAFGRARKLFRCRGPTVPPPGPLSEQIKTAQES